MSFRGQVRRPQQRHRPPAAALLDAVRALIERVGAPDRGRQGRGQSRGQGQQSRGQGQAQRLGQTSISDPSTEIDPRISHGESSAPGKKGRPPANRAFEAFGGWKAHVIRAEGESPPPSLSGQWGESPGEERGKRRKRKKGRIWRISIRKMDRQNGSSSTTRTPAGGEKPPRFSRRALSPAGRKKAATEPERLGGRISGTTAPPKDEGRSAGPS